MTLKRCVKISGNDNNTKEIYACVDLIGELCSKLFKDDKDKRFKIVAGCIYRNQVNRDLYEKYDDFPGTSVMKLSKGKENLRIYCKVEKVSNGQSKVQKITMIRLHDKKVQRLSKVEKEYLRAIQNQDYEYRKWH